MKKLIMLSSKTKIIILLISIIGLIIIAFLSFFKIESTYNVLIKTGNDKEIYIKQEDVYKLGKNNEIVIKINNKYFNSKIENLKFDENSKLFKGKLKNFRFKLIEGSTINATSIYDNHTLLETILGV